MSSSDRPFDLERAFDAWRERFRRKRSILEEDLLELERHVRDDIEALLEEGMPVREAFFLACRRLGDENDSESEFSKVYWKKVGRLGRMRTEIVGRISLFLHYLRTTSAHLWRHPGYTAVQVVGLAAGLTVSLLLLIYIRHELGFDTFHEKADRVVRITSEIRLADGSLRRTALSPVPLASALETTVAGIENTARLTTGRVTIRESDGVFEQDLLYADPSLFDLFTFPLVQGDPESVLDTPGSIVLTASLAERLFGDSDVLGATITIIEGSTQSELTVTGIAASIPAASSIRFDAVRPLESLPYIRQQEAHWGASSVVTFAELDGPVDAQLRAALGRFVETHLGDRVADGQRSGSIANVADAWIIVPEPLEELHFSADVRFSLGQAGSRQYLMILMALAGTVLLIACMNFVTIALGLASERGREVGMRKVLGARPGQIRTQYWTATAVQSLFALAVAIVLTIVLVPPFRSMIGAPVSAAMLLETETLLLAGAVILVTGVLAGGYPALVQARFSPGVVLRSDSMTVSRGSVSRVLMVLQFAVAGILITGTLTMDRQWELLQNRDIGYDAENVLVVRSPQGASPEWVERFSVSMAAHSLVESTATLNNSFTRGGMRTVVGTDEDRQTRTWVYFADAAITDVLDLTVAEGRSFATDREGGGAPAVLVNRAFVRELDLRSPLGEHLQFGDNPQIVGIVEDFNFQSLHSVVEPAVIYHSPERSTSNILIRARTGRSGDLIDHVRSTWKELAPLNALDFYFLEDDIQRQYEAEARWNRLIRYATLWSLMLACTGLFGFAAIVASSRRKETGIRKVLGASVTGLLFRNMKAHLGIVAVALFIALPSAYLIFNRWLDNFAYRAELSWWIPGLSAVATLAAVVLTAGYHAVRAATTNPVDVLRSE